MKQLYKVFIICFLIIYSLPGFGQTFLQKYRVAGVGVDQLRDITTDNSDNFYVVGENTNKITDPVGLGAANATSKAFVIRYSSAGTPQWSNSINANSPNNVRGLRIAVDNAGNTFVVGSFTRNTVYFNGFNTKGSLSLSNLGSSTQTDGFIAKYKRSNNDTLEWVMAIGTLSLGDEISGLAIDGNGDVIVTGSLSGTANVYGKQYGGVQTDNIGTITSQGSSDAFVAKFSSSGAYQWGFSIGSAAGSEQGNSITTDASNNIYISGEFFNTTDFDPSAGSAPITAGSSNGDAFIAKYTSAGAYVLAGGMSGQNAENINSLYIGNSGALYVAGSFSGTIDADPRSATQQLLTATTGGGLDILLAKYDLNTFAPVFAQNIGGSGDDEAFTVKADASGNCYLTGYFTGSVNFNPTGTAKNLTSVGGKDIFISKYSSAGINSWAFSVGGSTDDQGTGISFNSLGNIYAGGFYTGTSGDFDPGAGVATLTNLGLEDSYISKYQECSMPVISSQPTPTQTLCAGGTITLSFGVTGSGVTYQWKKGATSLSDGGNISGSLSSTLTITPSVAGDAGTYTCVATSCGNSVTSNNAVVTINTPIVITTQPKDSSICSGNAAFKVIVTGTFPFYQWKKNGADITNGAVYSGVNAATLNLVSPTAAEAGNYTVVVSGSCPSPVTSTTAAFSIGSGVGITTQPVNKTVCAGATVTFTVAATGATSYKWQRNNVNMSDGGIVSGSSTATLTLTGVTATDAANYRCVLTGSCGSSNSTAASLTISSAAVITAQPTATQTLCAGQTASFSVVATGAISYQWKKGGVDLTNTGNVTGATTATLQLAAITTGDAATYTCVVTGACAPNPTTSNAVLVVNTLPVITVQPSPSTICSGASTSFSVTATGTGLIYKWQKNNVDITDGGVYSGSGTFKLNITGATATDAANYRCIVSGSCTPAATSSAVALVINSTAAISSQPAASQTLCAGQTATFTVGTTGSGITFQWQKNGFDLTNTGTVSGVLTSSLSISNLTSTDAGNYRCVVTNACSGVLNSNAAALAVNALPAITSQPSSQTICGSSPITFTVGATGTGLNYQWKKDGNTITDAGVISGTTTATLSINPANASNAGAYTCVVNGTCNAPVTSAAANLVVGGIAAITTQPQDVTVCSGANATMTIAVSGSGLTYQWKKNNVTLIDGGKISGVSTASLTITGATAADIDSYTCITGNACSGALTSTAATIIINALPAITKQPADTAVCSGTSATFKITATGTGISYKWKKDGIDLLNGGTITGVFTNTLTISAATNSDAGIYTCEVKGTCNPLVLSTGASLNVNSTVAIVNDPISTTGCTGKIATFTCDATGGTLTYQWKKDGIALIDGPNISGATSFTLSLSSLTAASAGSYLCEVSGTCSSVIASQSATLSINTSSALTSQTFDTTVCQGNNAIFKVVATGTGLAYQWLKDGTPLSDGPTVSGAKTATLTLYNTSPANDGLYRCDITSTCNFYSSVGASLTVNVPATITAEPNDVSACAGDNVSIGLTTTGVGLSFQWYKNSALLTDGSNIAGSTTNTLQLSNVTTADEASYYCAITGACGAPVTSKTVSLILSAPPVVITPLIDKISCIGGVLTLTIGVSNPGGVIYKWQKNGADIIDGGRVSGATTSTLTITSTDNTDAATYACIIATGCSSPTSSNASVVTVTTASAIASEPVFADVCKGQSAQFKVTLSGSAAGVMYQWQFKSGSGGVYTNISNGGKYSGATTATLFVVNADITEQGNYKCLITDPCGASQFTSSQPLTISSPNILQQPFAQTACLDGETTLTVIASGKNLVYRWYKDGVALFNGGRISGVLTASLVIKSTALTDAGNYKCIIKGICGPDVTSDEVALTVSPCTAISVADLQDPVIRIYPKPTTTTSTIEFNNRMGTEVDVAIFDLQGAKVAYVHYTLLSDTEQFQLPMNELAHGMYFIQIQMGEEYYSDKVEKIP